MHADRIDTMDGFAALEGAWHDVHARDPDAGYFHSWRWLAEVLRANPGRWRVIALRPAAGEAPVSFMPLRVKTRWSQRRGALVTELDAAGRLSWAQYAGFLCLPEWDERAIPALAAELRSDPWAYLNITNWLSTGRRRDLFLEGFAPADYSVTFEPNTMHNGTVDNLVCPYVPLAETFDAYLEARVSANTRQKIRRFLRKIDGATDLRLVDALADDGDAHFDGILDRWFRKWAPVRGDEQARKVVAKYREIVAQSRALGAIYMPTLWSGETLLGGLVHVVDRPGGRMYFILAGRDETAGDQFIGLALHAHSIRWAIGVINAAIGWIQYLARRFTEAQSQLQRTLDLDPAFVPARLWMGQTLEAMGQPQAAIPHYLAVRRAAGAAPTGLGELARAYALAGDRPQAQRALDELTAASSTRYVEADLLARVHDGLGNRAQALDWLERGFEERAAKMVLLGVDPQYDRLRDEPRFQALVTKMQLPRGR